jgi:uncharacterized protein YceH (UPF0502 family)
VDGSFDAVQVRALGCLIEKQIATPEYYPLTLNSLINACNQLTNRDPVTTYDEGAVARALEGLRAQGLVWAVSNSRVPKYGTNFSEKFDLGTRETAVMCVLMLRGPQTAGELRARTGRLAEFSSLEEVDEVLARLMNASPPFATKLPRLPGTKEPRFAQLLGGPVHTAHGEAGEAPATAAVHAAAVHAAAEHERIAQLEREIESLRGELNELRQQFASLKQQFE